MISPDLAGELRRMRTECAGELSRLSRWWLQHLPRPEGGYFGEINLDGTPKQETPVSIILMARLLWFFSAAADFTSDEALRREADRAAGWLQDVFIDREHGGVIWSATPDGQLVDGRKHGYAQGFAIYALSRHHRLSSASGSLHAALALFSALEQNFPDTAHGGYREAFQRDWSPLEDFRLSEKEGFAPKTMNTHLHILEAYTELARCRGDETVLSSLRQLLEIHLDRILAPEGKHLRVFMDDSWEDISESISFGHDIEASWLLTDAVDVLDEPETIKRVQAAAVSVAESVLMSGTGAHGEVFNERRLDSDELDISRIWWVQAEAMIGFLNAYAISGKPDLAKAALNVWEFTKTHVIAPTGEWRWHSQLDPQADTHWAGPWKGPYHNGRAMMEVIHRIGALTDY